MSTSTATGLNGRVKKSLAFQLDRLDGILDGLAEALNGAVADAVRNAVGAAAREAVQQALKEALAQTPAKAQETAEPVQQEQSTSLWVRIKAKINSMVERIRTLAKAGLDRLQQCARRYGAPALLALQPVVSAIKSRALRVALMTSALTACLANVYRKSVSAAWRGTWIVFSGIVLAGIMGLPGALLIGGAICYLISLVARFSKERLFANNAATYGEKALAAPSLNQFPN